MCIRDSTNYKKANWTEFTNHIESHINPTPIHDITTLNTSIIHLNNTIIKSANLYIPKGHRKSYNPKLSPEISQLIKQRNSLRKLRPYTTLTTNQITNLNTQISNLITTNTTNKFTEYLQSNISRIDNKKTWQVIKKLNNSQNNPPVSYTHLTLPTS